MSEVKEGLLNNEIFDLLQDPVKLLEAVKQDFKGLDVYSDRADRVKKLAWLLEASDQMSRVGKKPAKAKVILFKESGKYYTEEDWAIPEDAISPHDMVNSPDFRRIGDGRVLVDSQEPWGFPAIL